MNKLIYLIAIAGIIVLQSCGKDGAPGATGPAGANGNANVAETIYQVAPGAWSGVGPTYTCTVSDNQIVDASTDVVEVSYSFNGSSYGGMPATNVFYNLDNLTFQYQNGAITFVYYSTVGSPSLTMNFKVSDLPPQ